MKKPITLTIDDDLKKEAQDKGIVISELLREALIKATMSISKTNPEIKEFYCSWCSKPILDDYYFYCVHHKNIFCEKCAVNEGKKVWEPIDGKAPNCRSNIERIDCILEKHAITTEYAE